jgi:hypothetical protein
MSLGKWQFWYYIHAYLSWAGCVVADDVSREYRGSQHRITYDVSILYTLR